MKKIFYLVISQLLMLPVGFVEANSYFDGNKLVISNVDSIDTIAKYQDAVFSLTPEGQWELLSFKIGKEEELIKNVELIKTDTFPVQVFFKITGTSATSCSERFRIKHRKTGNVFEIAMYKDPNPPAVFCDFGVTEYTEIYPLPIFPLEKGEYTYTVNGNFQGVFTLIKDNNFQ